MANRKLNWVGAAAVAVAFGMAGTAQASQVYMSTWAQNPTGIGVTVAGGPPAGGNGTYAAGQFQLTLNPGNTLNNATKSVFASWCVDIFQNINPTQVYTAVAFDPSTPGLVATPSNPPGTFTAEQITQVSGLALLGNAAIDGNDNNNGLLNPLLANTTNPNRAFSDQEVSAAIQATIWRVLHPQKTITSSGDTQFLMDRLWTARATFTGSGGVLLRSGNGQDQLVFPGPGGGGFEVPVPAPAAAFIFALGLVGLAAVRRRA
jgi:hypothetical protein